MSSQDRLALLNRALARARNSPFYKERLPNAPLRALSEIQDIPLTTKEDLRRASPFGLICAERGELAQYHESFGTSGVPVSVWLTAEDLRLNAEALAGWGICFNGDDVVLVRFPYAVSGVAHMVQAAAQSQGACVVPVSARTLISPFPRVVELLRRLRATVLACLPLQALLVAETAELMGLTPGHDFPHLRAICTAGETLPPGRRGLLKGIWGVPVFDNYGLTEIGPAVLDCEFGRPHPLEEHLYLELLRGDLQTEAGPGELGHLVATTLRRTGTPMIRYVTGDLARQSGEECICCRSPVMELHGRKEDVLKAGGQEWNLWELDGIVSHLPFQRFWAVCPAGGGLRFVVEATKGVETIPAALVQELETRYRLQLSFEIVPRGSLYDQEALLSVQAVGKPRYVFTQAEMERGAHLDALMM